MSCLRSGGSKPDICPHDDTTPEQPYAQLVYLFKGQLLQIVVQANKKLRFKITMQSELRFVATVATGGRVKFAPAV